MRGVVIAVLSAVVVAGVWSGAAMAATRAITPSPAYTAAQLKADPGADWLMNMGNLAGTRHSSLTRSPRRTSARSSWRGRSTSELVRPRTPSCGSLEANAVVANGILLHADAQERRLRDRRGDGPSSGTGSRPTTRPSRRHGRREPGVAIGDGQVFVATVTASCRARPDARCAGLEDRGAAVEEGRPRLGRPDLLQRPGPHRRQRRRRRQRPNGMHAFDAATGRELWTWAIVPRTGSRAATPGREPTPTTAAARCGSPRSSTRS